MLNINWKPEVHRGRQSKPSPEWEKVLASLDGGTPAVVIAGETDKKAAQKLAVRFGNYAKRQGKRRGLNIIETASLIPAQQKEIRKAFDTPYIVVVTGEQRQKKAKG